MDDCASETYTLRPSRSNAVHPLLLPASLEKGDDATDNCYITASGRYTHLSVPRESERSILIMISLLLPFRHQDANRSYGIDGVERTDIMSHN